MGELALFVVASVFMSPMRLMKVNYRTAPQPLRNRPE
jgi:hypothetical protein